MNIHEQIDFLVDQFESGDSDLTGEQFRENLEYLVTQNKVNFTIKDMVELLDTLEFYADPNTYVAIGFITDPPCGDFINDFSKTQSAGGLKPGAKARELLKKYGYEF